MAYKLPHLNRTRKFLFISGISLILITVAVLVNQNIASASAPESGSEQTSPLHPPIPFLDENGESVLESGNPVSTINSCGSCHDTDFITKHSFHVSAGFNDIYQSQAVLSRKGLGISHRDILVPGIQLNTVT